VHLLAGAVQQGIGGVHALGEALEQGPGLDTPQHRLRVLLAQGGHDLASLGPMPALDLVSHLRKGLALLDIARDRRDRAQLVASPSERRLDQPLVDRRHASTLARAVGKQE
jgi:hypothetical protein